MYLLAAAGLAFIWFLDSLRARLRQTGAGVHLSAIAFGGGLVYLAMLFVGGAAFGVVPLAIGVGEIDAEAVEPFVARVLVQFGFTILLVYGLLAAAAMVLATSLTSLKAPVFPR